MLHALLIC